MHWVRQIRDHRCGPHCAGHFWKAGEDGQKPISEILPAEVTASTDPSLRIATAAHDFGNLLQVAGSALRQIERALDPGVDRHLLHLSRAASSAVERAGALGRMLVDQTADVEPAGPISVVRALRAIHPLIVLAAGSTVEVGFEIFEDVPLVACEIHEFENAVINLVTNARNAMPDGGSILLSLAGRGDTAVLSVRDNGPGMSAVTLAFVFTPFFTTRRSAGGRGLGLATVRQFADRNGGWVEIDSTPGRGTIITLGLPRAIGGIA